MSTAQKHGKNDRNAAPSKAIVSPKKARRTQTADDDTSRHLPELRTNRDRPSPAQRKISGSGAARMPGSDGISGVALGAGNNAAGFNLPFRAPTTPKRRLQRNHSTSPTPSRRLDTGHHETDVESDLEEGQIPEILPLLVFQETHLNSNETARTAVAAATEPVSAPTQTVAASVAAPADAAPADAAPSAAAPAVAAHAVAAPSAAAPAVAAHADAAPTTAALAASTPRRVTIEEVEDEDARRGRQTPPLQLWEPVILAVAAQPDIPPVAAAPRPRHTPPVAAAQPHTAPNVAAQTDTATTAANPSAPDAVIDVDMPQATNAETDVIDVDAPMPAPEDIRARQVEQAYAAPGPAAHPFVFADAQQAAAHGAGVAADVRAHGAPMYVFGTGDDSGERQRRPVIPRPHHNAAAMEGVFPVPAHAIPAGMQAQQAVLLGGPAGPAVVFVFPDINVHAMTLPTDQYLNPHRKLPAAQMPDNANKAGGATPVQPNDGDFERVVISQDLVEENMHPDDLTIFEQEPHRHLYAIIANGGPALDGKIGKTLPAELTDALALHGDAQNVLVFAVAPKDPSNASGSGQASNYRAPFVYGIRVADNAMRTAMRDQGWFAKSRELAAYVLGAEDFTIPWAGPQYAVTVGAGTDACLTECRGALSDLVWHDPALGRAIAQYTSTFDNSPLDERRYKLSQSIDPRWAPDGKTIVVYMRPCTPNPAHWRAILDTICGHPLRKGYYKYAPLIDPLRRRPGPLCVLCKDSTHFASTCPFKTDPKWWGPQGQLSEITEGPLAGARASAPPANRGGNRGGRGGRGRGGRRGRN
ncbi:hypothetical protein C8R47DRAFT_1328000 [Mycena vitilis]|nr:hypothetical protein C8R47DRAFT_1328000 [Mycena vitilis]